jgi:transposase InsO family protein
LRFTSTRIAAELRMAVSTVGAVLARLGLNRLSRLAPPEPPNRDERRRPGELVHLDIKKLGRFVRPGHRVTGRAAPGATAQDGHGWDFVHVAVDDCSRVAYVEVLDSEQRAAAIGFLERAVAWFTDRGIAVTEILSDNGACYRSRDFAAACRTLQLTHRRTRPYRPRTNGKAERFIQTLLREWAYGVVYRTSHQRALALTPWLGYYNQRRPHGALGHQPPESRLTAA